MPKALLFGVDHKGEIIPLLKGERDLQKLLDKFREIKLKKGVLSEGKKEVHLIGLYLLKDHRLREVCKFKNK